MAVLSSERPAPLSFALEAVVVFRVIVAFASSLTRRVRRVMTFAQHEDAMHARASTNFLGPVSLTRSAAVWLVRVTALTLCILLALPLIGDELWGELTTRFEATRLDDGRPIAGFIALGGGEERIIEALVLARSYPQSKLLVTGAGEAPMGLLKSTIASERLIIEGQAKTTFENALFTTRMLGTAAGRWILVTSASHMPRAVACFRKAGMAVDPWPVPDLEHDWSGRFARTAHEAAGLLVYWLEGKTLTLFPTQPTARNS